MTLFFKILKKKFFDYFYSFLVTLISEKLKYEPKNFFVSFFGFLSLKINEKARKYIKFYRTFNHLATKSTMLQKEKHK